MGKPSDFTAALRASAHKACGLLSALAHEDRLLLLCQLAHEERSVSELEGMLDIRQPSLSQHLGVLRRQKLVATRRDGKRIYYRLASEDARAVLDTLYARFCGNSKAR